MGRNHRRNPSIRRGPARLALCLTLLSLTAIFGLFGFVLYTARQDARQAAWTASTNIATAISQQIGREVELLDLSLLDLRDGAAQPQVMAMPPSLRHVVLFDRAGSAHGLGALLLLDANGRVVEEAGADHPPPIDLSREPFFEAHLGASGDKLFVSQPFVSLIDGETSIALSRRVERGGAFAGVAVATIKLSHIADMFSRIELGPADTLSLQLADGTVIVRQPPAPVGVVRSKKQNQRLAERTLAPSGTFEAVSPLDGVRRQYFYNHVDDLPLVQFVGRRVDDVYAAWRARALTTAVAMFVLGNTILGLVLVLQVELRRRRIAEAALAVLASTDTLTGLANRREFDARLDAEWGLARESRRPMALLLLDVDHFKALNDRCGHQAGDTALAALGACLGHLAGVSGCVARYGGEEFALLLPRTDAAGALRHADRTRSAVARLALAHPSSPSGLLTVSIGVAVAVPRPGDEPSELLRAADDALYEAKRAGRNRAVIAGGVARAA